MFEDIRSMTDKELLSDMFDSARTPYYEGKSAWDCTVRSELIFRGYR